MYKLFPHIFLLLILFSSIILSNTINLSDEEKDYLKNNPIIKVHNETNWPPYNYNKNGQAYGYSIEYMKLLASKVDMNVEFVSGYTWNQFLDLIKNHKIDVMLNIAKTKQRDEFLAFTSTYHTGVDVIFTRGNNIYNSLNNFDGKTLSVVKGFYEEELLRKYYPNIKIVTVKNSFEALKLVAFGKVDGAIDNLATGNYIISKYQLSNIEPSFEIANQKFNLDLHLATSKDNTILRDILEKAKNQITELELQKLKKIWIFNNKKYEKHVSKKLNLTISQLKYLKEKKRINMCIDPNWMPFEKFDKNGKHVGLTADYFKIFQDNLGIEITPIHTKSWNESLQYAKNRKCDILSLAMQTEDRKKYLNFTTSYLKIPLVLATKIDVPFVNDLSAIKNKKVGITKNYAFVEPLKRKYKNINIVEVENIQDGLNRVNNGELFGYIGTLASISYQFQNGLSGELKITGKLDESWKLGIAVRNDDGELFEIFEKVINIVDIKQQQKILNNWVSIKYEKGVDYTLLWKIAGLFLFILSLILAFLYNQNKLKNTIKGEKEKFEAIYQGSKDAIAILDMESNFLEVNESYTEMTGFTQQELLSTSCLKLTDENDIKASIKVMDEVLKVGFIRNFEKKCIVKSGENIIINMSMSLLHNPERILISVRDITKLKEHEVIITNKAYIDSLTMVNNRNKFNEVVEKDMKKALRYNRDLSIAIIDIDHFKDFNDTYGHLIGDEVLIMLAQNVNNNIRDTDFFARWGGEEFVLLFPETSLENSVKLCDKLRVRITELSHKTAGGVTASFGVTQYIKNDTIESMLKRCDDALYVSKENGRNRVEYIK